MLSKEGLDYIYQSITRQITSNESNWKNYLTFASKFYKYSFDNTLLVYAQNPKVTMLATYDIWNRVGRYVNRSAKGIAVFDYRDPEQKVQHLFDVKQTHGRHEPIQWQLTKDLKTRLLDKLNLQNGSSDKTLDDCLIQTAQRATSDKLDYYLEALPPTENNLRKDLRNIIENSASYLIFKRCGLPDKNFRDDKYFSSISQFNSVPLATLLGYAVTDVSKDVLLEIEKTLKTIQKERRNQYEQLEPVLHGEKRPELSEHPNIEQSGGRSAAGSLRTYGSEISQRQQTDSGNDMAHAGNIEIENASDRQRSAGDDRNSNPANAGERSGTENGRHSGENETPQRDPFGGGGNSPEGTDLQLNLFSSAEEQIGHIVMAEEVKSSAISVTQKDIENVLLRGSGFSEGKYRIYEQYQKHRGAKENLVFLKHEYGLGGGGSFTYSDGSDGSIWYDAKGIAINKNGFSFNHPDLLLKWPNVEERLRTLVLTGRYLTPEELKQYDEWKISQNDSSLQVRSPRHDTPPEDIFLKDIPKPNNTAAEYIPMLSDFINTPLSNREDIPESNVISDNLPKINYRYKESDNLYEGGAKTKFHNNVESIKLIKQIEEEGRPASVNEQKVLARYVGWGGLASAFDEKASSWQKEYRELKALLTDDEYAQARSSTVTAYYTEPELIRHMYGALEQFGFKGGRILDPAMGTGNFFSVLPESMSNSQLYGVELDSLTGRIAKQLYPKAKVAIKGFEFTDFSDNSFDLAVGNIPFNDYKVHDERYDSQHFLIHDYFIAKSIDKVKPGGMIAFITSKGTLDKQDSKVRRYIASRADLIGAVRLPNTAFKALAGTEVTTDILFLQKRESELKTDDYPRWVETAQLPDPTRDASMRVNQYFVDHPEMLLGEMRLDKSMYGNDSSTALFPLEGHDLYADLDTALSKLHARFKTVNVRDADRQGEKAEDAKKVIDAVDGVKNYTYTMVDGNLYYRENSEMRLQEVTGVKAERIKGLHSIRQALRRVIDIQAQVYEPETLTAAQRHLNGVYDEFVKKHGHINDKANVIAFGDDDDMPLLRSVEDFDKEKGTYTKAPIFYKATIRSYKTPEKADSALQALIISMNVKLKVDIYYMAQLYGKEPADITTELGDKIFINPEKYNSRDIYDGWELDEEYLSGNVKEKVELARKMEKDYPNLFSRNVEALERVQPKPLLASEIDFRIGSPWIPVQYYRQFAYETFGTLRYNQGPDGIDIQYSRYTTEWRLSNKHRESESVKVNKTFGTKRANAYMIYEDCLNLKSSTVRDPETYFTDSGSESVQYVVNVKETMVARSKQQQIKDTFRSWLFQDKDRCESLVNLYNDKFNNLRPRDYDGSNLVFKGMSQERELRPYQKDVVARILYNGTALMAHEVGAGKTASMIVAGMTLKQSGAIHKPVYVVPNSLLEQWQKEFMRFYPTANLLIATKKEFEKENRRRFFGKIATGDYDGIIIAQSSFEKIPISPERQKALIQNEIDGIDEMIRETKQDKGENWSIKQMELQRKKLDERYKSLSASHKKDNLLDFEQLGIDFMFVDEAHAYKNYFTYTKMQNVAGIGKTSSQRAMDMLMKCQFLQETYDQRGVVFATGTPISNSLSEMFVMQRYLQPQKLNDMGIDMFDNWAATFGEVVTALEITPEGSGYRMKSRFAKFHNLPELMNMFRLVADIRTADMLDLPIPKIQGGKPEVVVTECSEFQKDKVAEFAVRAEEIRNGNVDPSIDNMLKLTLEAKLLSIDPRLLNPNAENDPDSKLNRCINDVYSIWQETAPDRLTQIIFSDIGVPNNDGRFNVYDEVKQQLIAKGIPENEVAFVHDAKTDTQRETLFEKVRNGDVRVIIGSTQKLGTGTNIQKKLIDAHHLDCPWRPSDNTQRNGRIIRPGNDNPVIGIKNYVTKGTFDSYLWQIQEQKLRFITQIMTGKSISRSCDDFDETVLSAAEIKAIATDNPLVSKKMEIDNEVMRLKILKSNWENEKMTLERDISGRYPAAIKRGESLIDSLKRDIQLAGNNIQGDFSIVLGGQTFDKRTEAGDKIFTMAETLGNEAGDSIKIGTFKGFKVGLQRDGYREIQLVLEGSNSYSTKISDNNAGNTIRLENMIERLPGELTKEERDLELNLQQLEESKVAVKTPFEYEQRLSSASTEQVEIETQLEFDKSKSEDVITSDVTENTMEVSPMANDIANRKPNAKTPAAELNDAIKENDDARLDQLLSSGVDVQKLYNDTTFLHIAVENDSYECAKKLLNHGVYADGFNKLLETPLYTAVEKNNIDMADLLLDSGANPELCVKGVQIQDYSKSAEMDQLIMDHNLDRNKGDGQTRGKTR